LPFAVLRLGRGGGSTPRSSGHDNLAELFVRRQKAMRVDDLLERNVLAMMRMFCGFAPPIADGQSPAIYGRSPTLSHRRSNVGCAQSTDLRARMM
jgi:hypothetical protein